MIYADGAGHEVWGVNGQSGYHTAHANYRVGDRIGAMRKSNAGAWSYGTTLRANVERVLFVTERAVHLCLRPLAELIVAKRMVNSGEWCVCVVQRAVALGSSH